MSSLHSHQSESWRCFHMRWIGHCKARNATDYCAIYCSWPLLLPGLRLACWFATSSSNAPCGRGLLISCAHWNSSVIRQLELVEPRFLDPALPPDTRIYAIGDIHGRADLLHDVIQRIDDV